MVEEVLEFEGEFACVALSLGYVPQVLRHALIAFTHLYSNIIYSVQIARAKKERILEYIYLWMRLVRSLFGENGPCPLIEFIFPACHIEGDFQLVDHDVN